jgi:hypothetical protein
MLVILMENQMLAPQRVCQGCLLADATELRCGHPVAKPTENLPDRYECQMGFTIANIK